VPLAEMHTAQSLARDRRIPPPASDVLGADFNDEAAVERLLSYGDLELGEALLRQNVLAGVGNVFKSEICFAAGLNPFRKVASLTREQLTELVSTARGQLAQNVLEDSGDQIVTYRGWRRTTHRSDPGESLWVYGRTGQPCRRCGELICSRLQGADARATYWCPRCQRQDKG
jgi:endonuclease-8